MRHGLQRWPGWQLQDNNHPIQDTAHGLRLEPLIKSQNQNLELVPNLMTDSGGVEQVPRPERHGSVCWSIFLVRQDNEENRNDGFCRRKV